MSSVSSLVLARPRRKSGMRGILLWIALAGCLTGCSSSLPVPGSSPALESGSAGNQKDETRSPGTDGVSLARSGSSSGAGDLEVNTPTPPKDFDSSRSFLRTGKPKPIVKIEEPKPDPPYEPKVFLSESQLKTCVVKLQDTLPDLAFQNSSGEPVQLQSQLGPKLTLLVFWNQQAASAKEQRERLEEDLKTLIDAGQFHVLAIHVGDTGGSLPTELAQSTENVVALFDPDGSAFAQVATEKLPRTYLLSPSGQVLWFDIEYSRDTLRELHNAIRWHSEQQPN